MKQITVTLSVDEAALHAESSLDNLEEAINQELGWLHDSGMFVDSWSYVEPEKESLKVNCLCEEFEDIDGIREFTILAASHDMDALRKLLRAKILQDEYDFVKEKGIDTLDKDYFCTKFECGFVEYYIMQDVLLTPDALKAMIQEAEQDIDKDSVVSIINHYIDDRLTAGDNYSGIVEGLLALFPKEDLEDLGFGSLIGDYLMSKENQAETYSVRHAPLDKQIAKAEAIKVTASGAESGPKEVKEQGRE